MSNNIERSSQEKRTAFVVIFAFCVMIAEVIVGLSSHSMALFADGVHMGSHVLVIGLNWAAYILVRRLENKGTTHYDTEKILNLSAFTSGILLILMAIFIIFCTSWSRRYNGLQQSCSLSPRSLRRINRDWGYHRNTLRYVLAYNMDRLGSSCNKCVGRSSLG